MNTLERLMNSIPLWDRWSRRRKIGRWRQRYEQWQRTGGELPMPHYGKQLVVAEYGRRFHIPILIETGTYTGHMVVAMVEGEVTLKRFYREGQRVRLQPANSIMQPIFANADDVGDGAVTAGRPQREDEQRDQHLHQRDSPRARHHGPDDTIARTGGRWPKNASRAVSLRQAGGLAPVLTPGL